MTKMLTKLKSNLLILSFLLLGSSVFGATFYSDPSSANVALNNAEQAAGWSLNAAGPFNVTITINKVDHVVIQKGSTVTAMGSGLTFNNITLDGGTLVISASSINVLGNITGNGIFKNDDGNYTRIKMQGNNKIINLNATGNAGLTIVRSVSLGGNTNLGGRIAIDSLGVLDLAGQSLTIDNIAMKNGALIKGNIASALSISSELPMASTLIFDNVANQLASLSINNAGGVNLISAAVVTKLNLTKGKVLLGDNNLNVGTIAGGSEDSYIVTTGTGAISTNVEANNAMLFPVGSANAKKYSTYNPVTVKPAKATTFSVGVSNTFSQALANEKKVVNKQWIIISSNPSATELSFSPKIAPTVKSAVVGVYANGAWVEIPANFSENTFKASSNNFGAFGAGEKGSFISPSN
jgi:hypothetical protein